MALDKVTTGLIADDAITTALIINDAVTGAKLENSPTVAANLTVTGNFTVSGTTTTINTTVTASDAMVINNAGSDVGLKVNSTSTGHIMQLQDNGSDKVIVADGGTTTFSAPVLVGLNGTGHDVRFYGATSSKFWLWDESDDTAVIYGNQTTHGFQQINGYLKLGVNDTGYDFTVYGDTSGKHMLWDASADKFQVTGTSIFDGNVGINDTDPSEAKLSIYANVSGDVGIKVEQDQANNAMLIQQDGDSSAIYVDNNQTGAGLLVDSSAAGIGVLIQQAGATNALKIEMNANASGIFVDNNGHGNAIEVNNDSGNASGLKVSSTRDGNQAEPLVYLVAHNSAFAQPVLKVTQLGSGLGYYGTTSMGAGADNEVMKLYASNSAFDQPVFSVDNRGSHASINTYNTGNGPAISIDHDGAGRAFYLHNSSGGTGMYIEQDFNNYALEINMDGQEEALWVDSTAQYYTARFQNTTNASGGGILIKAASGTGYVIRAQNKDGSDMFRVNGQGDGWIYNGTWGYNSDRRLKENIEYFTGNGTDVINALKPTKFDYIVGSKDQLGFISQDVQPIIPEAVLDGETEEDMQTFKNDFIIPWLVKALQETTARLTALENA